METLKLKVELSELYRLKEFINIHYKEDIQIRLVVEEIFVNIVNYSGADYIIVNLELDDCLKLESLLKGYGIETMNDYDIALSEKDHLYGTITRVV